MAFEKIKKSRFRSKIEQMLTQGASPRKIASWLEKRGEQVSYLSIHQYRKQEFNFLKAAVDEMDLTETSGEIFEEGKRSVMADISFCNRVIEIAERKISELQDENEKVGKFKIFVEAGLKAIDMKLKISGEANHESTTINLNQVNIDELKVGIKEQLREIEELQAIEAKAVGRK
jgi:hypothetical protein